MAAETGRSDVVPTLVEFGADVACLDASGRDALFTACEHGHLRTIQELLRFKADPLAMHPVDFQFEVDQLANRALEMRLTSHRRKRETLTRRATVLDFINEETGVAEATCAMSLCIKTRPGAAAKICDSLMKADSDQGWTFEVGVEFLRLQELLDIDAVRQVHDSGHFRLLEHQVLRHHL